MSLVRIKVVRRLKIIGIHRYMMWSMFMVDAVCSAAPPTYPLKIAGAVSHGVAVFDEQKRLFGRIVQVISDFGKTGIHAAKQIDVGRVKRPVTA